MVGGMVVRGCFPCDPRAPDANVGMFVDGVPEMLFLKKNSEVNRAPFGNPARQLDMGCFFGFIQDSVDRLYKQSMQRKETTTKQNESKYITDPVKSVPLLPLLERLYFEQTFFLNSIGGLSPCFICIPYPCHWLSIYGICLTGHGLRVRSTSPVLRVAGLQSFFFSNREPRAKEEGSHPHALLLGPWGERVQFMWLMFFYHQYHRRCSAILPLLQFVFPFPDKTKLSKEAMEDSVDKLYSQSIQRKLAVWIHS